MDIIYILWLRQLKRYWRSKSRIIGSIGQPILFLVALGFGMGPMFEKAGGGNYINFLDFHSFVFLFVCLSFLGRKYVFFGI